MLSFFFFFNDTATTEIYTLSLHDALPIFILPHENRPDKTKAQGILKKRTLRALSGRSEEHTSELQSRLHLVCRLLLEKKKNEHKEAHHEPQEDCHGHHRHHAPRVKLAPTP